MLDWFQYMYYRFQFMDFDIKFTLFLIFIGLVFTINLMFFLYRALTRPESLNSNYHSSHHGKKRRYYGKNNYFDDDYRSLSSSLAATGLAASAFSDSDNYISDNYMSDDFSSSHNSGPTGLFGGDYNTEMTMAASGIEPYSDAYGFSSGSDSFSSFSSDSFGSSSFDSGSSFDNHI